MGEDIVYSLWKHKAVSNNMQKLIDALNKYHPDYTYDISSYINARTYMSFTCPVHGQFLALPMNVIKGTGCKKCAMENLYKLKLERTKLLLDPIIENNNRLYGYIYDLSSYNGYASKIDCNCPLHGKFSQYVANIIRHDSKCPKCYDIKGKADGGINFTTISRGQIIDIRCYLIKLIFDNQILYKVGLSKNLNNRFAQIKHDSSCLYIEKICILDGSPLDLFKLEQVVVDTFKYDSGLSFKGHTEILSMNPLNFIKTYITNTDIQLTTEY